MKNLLLTFLILSPSFIFAQFGGATNGNPSTIEWKEISNESARIIFPDGLEKRAEHVADVIDYLNKNSRKSIGKPKGKINIIFQNQLTEANGFVTAAPFRSEFFTTAPQRTFAGTQDWLDLLAIHEYRHVMQFQFSKQGVTKIGAKLFGQGFWSAMNLLSIPFWFVEGDAVMQETLLSEGGRGRSGSFLAEYRAMHEAGMKYPYEKIRNRSFKSVLPNRYRMGYLFSEYGRNNYGNTLWRDVAQDAVRYKGVFWSFSQSLKRKTGKNVGDFYDTMMDSIYLQWDREKLSIDWQQSKEQLKNKKISKNKVSYYAYPKYVDDQILAIKSGRDRIPEFYLIDSEKKEKKLFNLGYHDFYFNYKNGKMVWTQSKVDIRWGNKTFSNIYIYDFKEEKKIKLTSKSKYFSPDINEDGSKILVVESNEMMRYQILILSGKTGEIRTRIPNPKNIFVSSPKWLNENTIIAVAQQNQKNALMEIDITTGEMTPIIDYTKNLILTPAVKGDFILFSGDFADVRNIFAVNRQSKKLYQVTNSRVLAEQPMISDDGLKILFVEQQIQGADIKEIEFDQKKWKPVTILEPIDRYLSLNELSELEGGSILSKIPKQKYKVSPYAHFKDGINLHSWAPTLAENNTIGIQLHSTNLLSTLDVTVSGVSNFDSYNKLATKITWNKYYPQLSLGHDMIGFDAKDHNQNHHFVLENRVNLGIDIPLNFSESEMIRKFNLETKAGYLHQRVLDDFNFNPDQIFTLGGKISLSNKRQKSFQQLESRAGNTFDVSLENRFHSLYSGRDLALKANIALFFPGFARTHSTVIKGHHFTNFDQTNIFNFNENGLRSFNSSFQDINNVLSVDYAFPIAYPDFGLKPFIFLKRLRANLFYEYGSGFGGNSFRSEVHSFGIELRLDSGFFNLGSAIDLPIGVRASYSKINQSEEFINFQFLFFN